MTDVLTEEELKSHLIRYPEWHRESVGGVACVRRVWTFDNFIDAFRFAGRVAELAEKYNHHPQLTVSWGELAVAWWSHDAGGVTQADMEMVALCDHLST